MADGKARSLLAAGPNCSGGPKCELITGPAQTSGPHAPGGALSPPLREVCWASPISQQLPSWGGGRPCLDPHLLPPSPGPHNSQSLEAPFSPLQGPLGSPVRPGRFLFTGAQSSCSQRRATDARGRMAPPGQSSVQAHRLQAVLPLGSVCVPFLCASSPLVSTQPPAPYDTGLCT